MGKYNDAVLSAIDDYWKENYHPPTIRKLMDMAGIPSTSHTASILRKLKSGGLIELFGNAHPIPKWVISAIDSKGQQET